MGAVSIDVYRKEREYEHLTLSDVNVVRYLILYRSAIDLTYGASCNFNIYQAGDTMNFNQELIVLYASLDNIISRIRIKDKDRKFLDLIFEGNDISEIIEHHDYPRKTAYRTMERIVDKISEVNKADWEKTMLVKGYVVKE